jgi:hypothetical protein
MGGRVAILLALLFCCSVGRAEEVVEIPLSEVWALDMPGTKDVRLLEPEVYGDETKTLPTTKRYELLNQSLIQQVLGSLELEVPRRPMQGFLVASNVRDSLSKVSVLLAASKKPPTAFESDKELTLVFYSLQTGTDVHLTSVNLKGNQINIEFRFVPHFTDEMSTHFALIPLPKLSAGKYKVRIHEAPVLNFQDWGVNQFNPEWRKKFICKDFEFKIE